MIIPVSKLKEALKKVAPMYRGVPVVPIVSHVWIESDGQNITIRATNLNESIELKFEVNVKNKEEIVLPYYADFVKYINLLNEVEIELSSAGRAVEIKAGKAKSRLEGEVAEDFPEEPKNTGAKKVVIETEALRLMKEKILPFSSTDEFNPQMNGVNMRVAEGVMTLESSDNHQIAKVEMSTDIQEALTVNFGRSMVETAAGLFTEKHTSMKLSNNHVELQGIEENTRYRGGLIEEEFPKQAQGMFDLSDPCESVVDKALWTNELKRCVLFANKNITQISVRTTATFIETKSVDVDYGREYTNKVKSEGTGDFSISLPGNQMLKAIGMTESEDLKIIHQNDVRKPVIIDDGDLKILTIPMNPDR